MVYRVIPAQMLRAGLPFHSVHWLGAMPWATAALAPCPLHLVLSCLEMCLGGLGAAGREEAGALRASPGLADMLI